MKYDKSREFSMLQDVITHFGSNPSELRSIVPGHSCSYNPPLGRPKSIGCAIGMYIPKSEAMLMDVIPFPSIRQIFEERINLLPPWMRKMDPSFLTKIQVLHDSDYNWRKDFGLSYLGMKKVKSICKKHDIPFEELTFPE